MQFISSISGFPISAQSAAYAPTNSAEVSAIASAYAGSGGTSVASLPISGVSGSSTAVYGGESTRIVSAFGDYRKETDCSAGLVIIAKDDYDNNTRDRLDITPTGISNMHYNQGSVTNSWQFGSNEYGYITNLQSNSSNWNNKQDALTFGFDGNDISSINGYAIAGGGGGGGAASLPISGSSENGDQYWQGEYNVSELSVLYTSNNITKSTHIDPASIYLAETAYGTARNARIDCDATDRWDGYSSTKQDKLKFYYNASNEISSINGSALAGVYFDSAACSAIASAYASGKQDSLTFGYDSGAISSINGSAIAGGSGGGGGGSGGDLFAYHAPAHSIIFWFYSANYNPSTDSNLSNVSGTWTQLSNDSNIWQLVLNTGSWNSLFYNSSTNGTRIASDFEILSIDFTGVTSLVNFMKNSRVTRIREILTNIECSADGAFENTSSLRGDVSIPALHNGSFSGLFKNSSVESVRINSLYAEFTPGWEGDPEMGDPGVDDYYNGATCSNMFNGCVHLRNVEIYSAHVGACDNMFRECRCLTEISCMENWDFCGGSFSYMFSGCRSLIWVPGINCYHPSWQGAMDEYSNGGNTDHMFQGCISLQNIPTLSGHFGDCSDASYMFQGCTSLVSIKWEKIQDLGYYTYKEWDEDSQMEIEVSRYVVNNVAGMFQLCGNVLYGAVNVYQNMNTYWNYISQHGSTFSFCGTDIGSTELASIPRTWGGTQS